MIIGRPSNLDARVVVNHVSAGPAPAQCDNGHTAEAIELAWEELARNRKSLEAKSRLAWLLRRNSDAITESRSADLIIALDDFDIDPVHLSDAGWTLVLRRLEGASGLAGDAGLDLQARQLEQDALCLKLLKSAPVFLLEAEILLTRLRRRLLLTGTLKQHPSLLDALTEQARINGGAWQISADELLLLEQADTRTQAAFSTCFTHSRDLAKAEPAHPVTRQVKALYEDWPYPAWQRITRSPPWTLPDMMRQLSPQLAEELPVNAEILVAGCGSGRQAALIASEFPEARITAIDLSEASIEYGRKQCEAIGISEVRFANLDIYDVAQLNRHFDAIFCDGVLHHMPDPEGGLHALLQVLQPHGAIHLSLYSKLAWMMIEGAMAPIRHLIGQEPSADRLREARGILLSRANDPIVARTMELRDFATLQGFADLLFHPHRDFFDIPRISRMMELEGLEVVGFDIPSLFAESYARENPQDALGTDLAAIQAFELRNPLMFLGMYAFWCTRARTGTDSTKPTSLPAAP